MKRLTPSLRKFCEKDDLLRVAWIDRKGFPRIAPVWFVVLGGSYYFGTAASSPKWKAMKRNPRAGWLIDGKKKNYLGAAMSGLAEEVNDPKLRSRVYRALGVKYFGSATHRRFVELYGRADDAGTVYVRLKAQDGISWEY